MLQLVMKNEHETYCKIFGNQQQLIENHPSPGDSKIFDFVDMEKSNKAAVIYSDFEEIACAEIYIQDDTLLFKLIKNPELKVRDIFSRLIKKICEYAEYKGIEYISPFLDDDEYLYESFGFTSFNLNNKHYGSENIYDILDNIDNKSHITPENIKEQACNKNQLLHLIPSMEILEHNRFEFAIVSSFEGLPLAYAIGETNIKEKSIELSNIRVDEDLSCSDLKLGTKTLLKFCQEAHERGFEEVSLTSLPESKVFYEKLGFKANNPNDSLCFMGEIKDIIANIEKRNLNKNHKPILDNKNNPEIRVNNFIIQ